MSVVMLSGPVGAGKTTVARELVAISQEPLCYIECDTLWPLFAKPGSKSRRERFSLLMRSATAAAVPLARGGYEVLLDFSFPLDFIETAHKILKEIDYSEYRDFYTMFEGLPKHEIADDEGDARSVARRIRAGLDQGIFRLAATRNEP
ncbi:MAG: hypothetical protein ABSD61_05920 [Terracidiphilus sp.]|jgi:hypothetical protein